MQYVGRLKIKQCYMKTKTNHCKLKCVQLFYNVIFFPETNIPYWTP